MWKLDHKDGWAPKNWCFWTVVLEKTLESPLDCKEIKLVNPKGNQSWIFIGKTDAEAPILWPPDVNSQLIGKDPDAGKDCRQEEKWVTGWDGWMASLNQWMSLGKLQEMVNGQGSLVCCSPWEGKESDMTEWTTSHMCIYLYIFLSKYLLIYNYPLCVTNIQDVKAGFRKGRGIRNQIVNIHWIIENAGESQKNIFFCFIDYSKAFDCVDQNKLWKILKDGNTRPLYLPPEKSVCRSRSNR